VEQVLVALALSKRAGSARLAPLPKKKKACSPMNARTPPHRRPNALSKKRTSRTDQRPRHAVPDCDSLNHQWNGREREGPSQIDFQPNEVFTTTFIAAARRSEDLGEDGDHTWSAFGAIMRLALGHAGTGSRNLDVVAALILALGTAAGAPCTITLLRV